MVDDAFGSFKEVMMMTMRRFVKLESAF